jgi:tetratricopeptide (TPR) repeat protein
VTTRLTAPLVALSLGPWGAGGMEAIHLGTGQAPAVQTTVAPQAEPVDDLADVRRSINAGEPRQALERLRTLADESDESRRHRIALLRGVAHYHADEPAKAVEALMPIVDRFPAASLERRESEQVLGLALFTIGRFADAVPRLEATREWAPENLELAYALGQAYIQVQRPAEARSILGSLYGVPPDSAAAHLIAAQTMIRLEMESLAEPELQAAIDKDPRLPHAHFLLGQIALFRGRLDDAVTLSSREIAVNPGHAMAFSQLGDAYVRRGRWDDAIAALQKSLWLNPYYSAPYILLGRAYTRKGDPAAAEGMFRRAIHYDPNNRAAHYLLGQLLQQLGRVDEAKRELEIAERLQGTRGGP